MFSFFLTKREKKFRFPKKVKVNWGHSIGKYWLEIDGKLFYEGPAADFVMSNKIIKDMICVLEEKSR